MATSFSALVYRPDRISDRALSRGFAVALAGFDVEPVVTTADIRSAPGFRAAFYQSGRKLTSYEELDHACDLFEEELPPGLAVRDAAEADDAEVFAIVFSDEIVHDDAWCFGHAAFERRFVREGDDGLEAGVEGPEEAEVIALADDADVAPHRGSTLLSSRIGMPMLPALVGALFEADRRVPIHLVDPAPSSIAEETRALVHVLGRVDGRGRVELSPCAGVEPPPTIRSFNDHYDRSDPTDPSDLYRELSIGRVEGTLHFFGAPEMEALCAEPAWRDALAGSGAYPLATLLPSALGGSTKQRRIVAVAPGGERLVVLDGSQILEAGPTLGELVAYLALGFKRRDEVEEDVIGALMLRAKIRCSRT